MGKRYFCEVCDKSFADNVTNRKNHLKGVVHQRNTKAHYDACRDAATILNEESTKIPCKKFAIGQCMFGAHCRFSHITMEYRKELEKRASEDWNNAKLKAEERKNRKIPTLEDWLKKYESESCALKKTKTESNFERMFIPEYTLPDFLKTVQDLPPSLIPPNKEAFLSSEMKDWG